jgi:xanthine dehydrogenase accessory factor
MKNIYVHLSELLKEKKQVALATIIEATGSTPQVPGASAIFSSERLLAGTLGGGLLEGDALKRAQDSLKRGGSLLYPFNLNADISSGEESICGGQVRILLDVSPMKHEHVFNDLHQSFLRRKPGLLSTWIKEFSGGSISIFRNWIESNEKSLANLGKPLSILKDHIVKALAEEKPVLVKMQKRQREVKESLFFLEPVIPLPRLVIAGAGHVARAVAHLGNFLDFEVTVIDDRSEFADRENIPDADHVIVDQIAQAITKFPVGPDTYLVIVTRGHHYDAEALRECIASDAAYIGMIGSARKVKLMREKFLERGWASEEQFDRIHAPIGLDIGSKTVEEIALSIAAQLVEVRSQIRERRKGRCW